MCPSYYIYLCNEEPSLVQCQINPLELFAFEKQFGNIKKTLSLLCVGIKTDVVMHSYPIFFICRMDRKARIQNINSRYRLGGAGARSAIVSETALGRQTVTRVGGPVNVGSTTFLPALTSTSVATPIATTFATRPVTTTIVPTVTTVGPRAPLVSTPVLTPTTLTATTPILPSALPAQTTTTVVGPLQPIRQTVQTIETVSGGGSPTKSEFQPTQANPNYWEPDVVGSDSRKRLIEPIRRQNCCERCTALCPRCCGCPWWLCFLLTLLLLGLLIGALQFFLRGAGKATKAIADSGRGGANSVSGTTAGESGAGEQSGESGASSSTAGGESGSTSEAGGAAESGGSDSGSASGSDGSSSSSSSSSSQDKNATIVDSKQTLSCISGYFLHKDKCLRCPGGSKWNGSHCIKKEVINKIFVAKIVKNSSGTFVVRNQTADGERGQVTPGFENAEKAEGQQGGQQGQQGGEQQAGQQQGGQQEGGETRGEQGGAQGDASASNANATANSTAQSGNATEQANPNATAHRHHHLKSHVPL